MMESIIALVVYSKQSDEKKSGYFYYPYFTDEETLFKNFYFIYF